MYLGDRGHPGASVALGLLSPGLKRWDRRAASTATRYLTNSTTVRARIWKVYGIDAEVLPPPPTLDPSGPQEAALGLEPGFFLCVSRLLPYKHVDIVMEAVASLPWARLVIVGSGPDERRLRSLAGDRIRILGRVDDAVLRWCYANCSAVVAASYEDFGLSPLEGNCFGKPSVVLRAGGFLDTVLEGVNGTFFDELTPAAIAGALRRSASDR
jgi:glycosyltransferase involved in cell wall biosynthesis